MADDTSGGSNLFGSLITTALQFATPFAQQVVKQSSTPAAVQRQTLSDAALNGSGPADPILANQAPQGLLDFITGARVTGTRGTASNTPQGGLGLQGNLTFIGIAAIAIIAVFVILKK